MKHERRLTTVLFITIFLIGIMTTGFNSTPEASTKESVSLINTANFNDPISIIKGMIQAINVQDPYEYMSYFTNSNRTAMTQFLSNNKSELFFKEKEAKLIQIKELPKEVGVVAAGISPGENLNLDDTRIFYAEINFKVDKEDKWLYNGTNHRVIVVTKEDGSWKIVRLSVPSIEYLKDTGNGFNSEDENIAVKIESTLDKKGQVMNMNGVVIDNIAASEKQLKNERLNPRAIEPEIVIDSTVAEEHTRPSNIRVYMTNPVNVNHYGSGTYPVDFGEYVYNVLPNEWGDWYETAKTAVQAGAIAVKMYGWYHVYHPKWNFSPYYADVQDNTNDQVYKYNSETTNFKKAVNDVGGIGVDILSGLSYVLFEVHYVAGYEGPGGQYSGTMWQYGTLYWAKQGKGYTYMCHYYWDRSATQPIHFFYY